jgi:methionyl-tRNA formyltransferase
MTLTKMDHILLLITKRQGFLIAKYLYLAGNSIEVITIDDSSDKGRSFYKQILSFAKANKISVSVWGREAEERILNSNYSLIVLSGWTRLLSYSITSKFTGKLVGIHNSLLPRYRGCAPLAWAMIHGDNKVGASAFLIDSGVDTGNVLHQWVIDVNNKDNITQVMNRMDYEVSKSLPELLTGWIKHRPCGMAQAEHKASYCASRKPEDSKVNWADEPERIVRMSKAMQYPYIPLFFTRKGLIYYIRDVSVSRFSCYGKKGQLVGYTQGRMLVASGKEGRGIEIGCAYEKGTLPTLNRVLTRGFILGEILA